MITRIEDILRGRSVFELTKVERDMVSGVKKSAEQGDKIAEKDLKSLESKLKSDAITK